MTAIADLSAGTIRAQIDISVPPAKVFAALTTPSELAAWWGSPEMYRTYDWQVDLRPGGAWSCQAETHSNGQKGSVRGKYIEIDAPRLLVLTWQPSWENFFETTIRYELHAIATGTRVVIVHTGFADQVQAAESHAEGWKRVLGWLAQFFQPMSSPST